jgi:hypothetical protein
MNTIKSILDEIANESGSNKKIEILSRHKDSEVLKYVLYCTYSPRVKYYIRQIPSQHEFYGVEPYWPLMVALQDIRLHLATRKFTGHDAIAFIHSLLKKLSPDDAFVFTRVLEKDLKLGMATTSINKVFPKLIEETPYMGAQSFSEKKAKQVLNLSGKAFSQVKMDGRYCNAVVCAGQVRLESRQGESTHIGNAQMLRDLTTFPDCVLNGELTIEGFDRYTANGIITSIIDVEKSDRDAKKLAAFEEKHGSLDEMEDRIKFTIWDALTLKDYDHQQSLTPYYKRLSSLENVLKTSNAKQLAIIESKEVSTYDEAMTHFQEIVKRGDEGTILKAHDGVWKDGKPAWQVKMKLEINLDLKIVGFEYGSKGSKNEHVITTLNLESSCGKLKTNPAGMNEKLMQHVTENQESLLGTIVEIRCCGLTPANIDGIVSTLHPSIEELRGDKNSYDSLQSAIEIENMAKGLSSSVAK